MAPHQGVNCGQPLRINHQPHRISSSTSIISALHSAAVLSPFGLCSGLCALGALTLVTAAAAALRALAGAGAAHVAAGGLHPLCLTTSTGTAEAVLTAVAVGAAVAGSATLTLADHGGNSVSSRLRYATSQGIGEIGRAHV